jgi:hypothetical protein
VCWQAKSPLHKPVWPCVAQASIQQLEQQLHSVSGEAAKHQQEATAALDSRVAALTSDVSGITRCLPVLGLPATWLASSVVSDQYRMLWPLTCSNVVQLGAVRDSSTALAGQLAGLYDQVSGTEARLQAQVRYSVGAACQQAPLDPPLPAICSKDRWQR